MKRRVFITLLCGAAVAWPHPAKTQQSGVRPARIGILSTAGIPTSSLFEAFRQELRRLGHVEGRNLAIEFRTARGDFPTLPTLASELVNIPVDVIVTDGGPATLAAKRATSLIPIVMPVSGDPVAQGIVDSMARPGGNITGLSLITLELSSKRIELLKEVVPAMQRTGVLWNPLNSALQFAATEKAGQSLGVTVESGEAQSPAAIPDAIELLVQRGASALIVLPDGLFWNERAAIVARAAMKRLPAIYPEREYVEADGLIAYGPSVPDNFRRAASYVDRILKGAKPADLPIEQPTKFELVVNLKTAKALGLTVPPSLLARADEVIE
jgi:putative ABC transport system substrate-binding protein